MEEYNTQASTLRNSYGQPVEEFELQFIDGESIDADLFNALGVHQGNFPAYLEAVEEWSQDDKIKVIIAVGEAGYKFDLGKDALGQFGIDLYELDSLKDLAEQFVEEGLYGEIPKALQYYIDYEAIARDLGMDYSEIRIDGNKLQFTAAANTLAAFKTKAARTGGFALWPLLGVNPASCVPSHPASPYY